TDLDSVLGDVGLYADANLKPLGWLTLRGGVRADLLTFDVFDNCAHQTVSHPLPSSPPGDASCLTEEDFGHHIEPVEQTTAVGTTVMPRGTVLVGPFLGLTGSASYGVGVRSMGPVDVNKDSSTAFASIESEEVGVSYEKRLGDVSAGARAT